MLMLCPRHFAASPVGTDAVILLLAQLCLRSYKFSPGYFLSNQEPQESVKYLVVLGSKSFGCLNSMGLEISYKCNLST